MYAFIKSGYLRRTKYRSNHDIEMNFFKKLFKKSPEPALENRTPYFEKIKVVESPLLLLPDHLDKILEERSNNSNESASTYVQFADQLAQLPSDAAKTRAKFIKLQCEQKDARAFFEQHRESWGIPKFEENLLTVEDFKNGFLWQFRDHSTSWSEDEAARNWFFNSIEARFAKHYQFWACDNGPEEILLSTSGNYKSILWTIVHDFQDYTALVSPVFPRNELKTYFDQFDEQERDFDKSELLEILEENPNW
jgi:hypothetical protein